MNASDNQGRKIMVVDDSSADRRLQIDYLRSQGYRLYAAIDGLDGVEKARIVQPNLILMDVYMPTCDGLAACRLLKADPLTAAIPLIFLTAAAQPDERVRGLMAGAVDYITKPFDFDEVRLRVGIHLQLCRQPFASQPEVHAVPSQVSKVDAMVFRAALRILLEDLAQPPDLKSLACAVGTNSRRLNEAFNQCVGATVFDYLREVRMEQARKLLRETSLAVQVIAGDLGYDNPANFATAFKERFGLSPRQYRQAPADSFAMCSTKSINKAQLDA